MSRYILAITLFLSLLFSMEAHADRQNISWNTGWRFLDSDAEPGVDTAPWTPVQVPHTWNVEKYRRGVGWYSKSFAAPASWNGKRVFVFFEAVSLSADVYLNGEKIDRHEGGFTAFCIELTSKLKFDAPNELRVRADNSRQGIAPDSADFNFNGGIYRPVHLIVSDRVMISPLDYGSAGVYITPRQVSAQGASIEVKTIVSNGSEQPAKPELEVEIFDAQNQRVTRSQSRLSLGAGQTSADVQVLQVERPRLWKALKDPYLYSVRVRLSGAGGGDEIHQPLGIRNIGFTTDERFLLNGELYPIRGVNRHQDWKGKAWELTEAEHKTDLTLIKDMGATAIRLAHYPQSQTFLDLCDRNGLLLWEEIPIVNVVLQTAKFQDNARQQLTEMIYQGYNHPSIMVWGLFNEVHKVGDTSPALLIGELNQLAHRLDPYRPTVGASYPPAPGDLNRVPDHLGFNIYPGWYGGVPQNYTPDVNKYSDSLGGRRIALSEYGAGASVIQHKEGEVSPVSPGGKFHPEEWQTFVHQSAWAQLKDHPRIWGTFVWVMFDFAVNNRNEGDRPRINDKGLVTDDRKTRKDAYFFYKANWNPEPLVHIAARRMTPRKNATTQVKVFSNASNVELWVNGKSLGLATPDSVNVFRWEDVSLQAGVNRIEARTKGSGKTLVDSCEWVLEGN